MELVERTKPRVPWRMDQEAEKEARRMEGEQVRERGRKRRREEQYSFPEEVAHLEEVLGLPSILATLATTFPGEPGVEEVRNNNRGVREQVGVVEEVGEGVVMVVVVVGDSTRWGYALTPVHQVKALFARLATCEMPEDGRNPGDQVPGASHSLSSQPWNIVLSTESCVRWCRKVPYSSLPTPPS